MSKFNSPRFGKSSEQLDKHGRDRGDVFGVVALVQHLEHGHRVYAQHLKLHGQLIAVVSAGKGGVAVEGKIVVEDVHVTVSVVRLGDQGSHPIDGRGEE